MFRIIDTETCGLQGGVVEVASVDVIDGRIVNPMSDLVLPDRPISREAMAVHRITEAMVAGKPPIEVVIPRYHGSAFYVAHNASFDRRMLPEMPGEWICTMMLARQLWPGIKYGNQALRHSLKLDVTPPADLHAHRALYDCYVTAALLIRILETSGWDAQQLVTRSQPAAAQGDVLPFGKYRGQSVAVVARKDPGYLRWMLDNVSDLRPPLRQALRKHLSKTEE
ncbi:exodeoxyribonuclease X [Candidatus Pantoea multigeneris]|uniref:Exodeoxyribonuclease X n=1 Tax=Candidatus Pantoea multigeneris TaxID=2608357 RepID=A0ABX0R4G0_9GAMM|nr:exodeoxyribonuclease X [Pantoea multigeneris]NIF20301.1 exodeoxyribonuclease X [Pantoea multigeneris]